MTGLNHILRPDSKTVSWLNNQFESGNVFVDDTFQRRSVWVEKNKARLIETILNDYPMPEIYLWAEKAHPASGAVRYRIVDGQQRLTAIRDFIANRFPLRKKYLNAENKLADYADQSFEELSDNRKSAIWDYEINTRSIPHSIERPQIVKMFLRLNETDTALNPQELRHAEFNGKFARNAELITNFKFWDKWDFFKPSDIRRMKDMQFVSTLLIFLRQGLETQVSQAALNKAYDLYNEKYPEAKSDRDTFESILKVCEALFNKDPAIHDFFRNQVHFYPLFVIIYSARLRKKAINISNTARKMKSFIVAYEKDSSSTRDYRLAATEGTQKRANIEMRIDKLTDWLGLA